MSRFIGDKRIVDELEDGDFVVVTFKDGTSERMTKKMLELSRTRESTDLTTLWDRQLGAVTQDILQVMLDWNIKLGQLDYLFNLLKSSLEHNNEKAGNILWGKATAERSMVDVDEVLQSTKNANGTE